MKSRSLFVKNLKGEKFEVKFAFSSSFSKKETLCCICGIKLFPLEKNIPLPIVGSFYNLFRKASGYKTGDFLGGAAHGGISNYRFLVFHFRTSFVRLFV